MNLKAVLKSFGAGTAVYVIVAACTAGDSARGVNGGPDGSLVDATVDKTNQVLDAIGDPVPRAEAAVTPCANWEMKVESRFIDEVTASGDWEPTSVFNGVGTQVWVLFRRCTQ